MIKRSFSTQESLARYWAMQAVELCDSIDGADFEEQKQAVLESVKELEKARRVVLIGAADCGKDALLAGMVGCPVMARVAMPHHYLRWRYLNTDGDAEHSRFIDADNLCGLEVVNTRDCSLPEVAEAVAPLLPGADAVVAVVNATAPENSPVWDMLANLPEEGGPACVLALTQVEKLDAAHAVTLSDAVREICTQRLGRVLPLYQVDVNNATLTADFGSKVVAAMEKSSGGLRALIREVMRRGSDLLYKQGSVLKARDAVARTNSGFLQGVDQEIDNFQTRQIEGGRNCMLNYAAAAQRSMSKLTQHLRRHLGWFLSPVVLIRLESYGAACENLYYRLVLDDIDHQQEELDKQFVVSCTGHWRSVRPRVMQALHFEIGDFPAAALEQDLEQLRQRLQSSLYEPFREMKLRSLYGSLFKRQVDWMRFLIYSICTVIVLAGVLGFLAQDGVALILLGVAAALWLLGSVLHILVMRKLCFIVRTSAEDMRECLLKYMERIVHDIIVSRVAAYRRLYTGPRTEVEENEKKLAPLQQRQSEIFRQLRSSVPRV